MKEQQEYIRDIAEMRSLMERSSKYMSLSGLSFIMAGIYALIGAYIAHKAFRFNPGALTDGATYGSFANLPKIVFLAVAILILAVGTAIFLSVKKAGKRGERFWNASARRLLVNMAVPLGAGGILIFILMDKGLVALVAPLTLVFYGLSLYNASKFTYGEIRSLGIIQIVLGLVSSYFTGYGLLFWALGFGLVHLVYGVYMHYRYER
ncbi:hypothetical protein [Paracnuella aquatica]|uniref:hypothetical protein n=1 Tax=Paracnuella aquatica TaxID=2268757 RepID=UPI000DEF0F2F|nr:hypothetical protein [Paracnuella aquatica]RPD49064.1 hypothetical protein DRJ53_08080 [Paracnuella aquatica]